MYLARLSVLILLFPIAVLSSYVPVIELYFTNALVSFWSPMPVNCATTIDLNPSALLPSAWRPHIPKTDLNEILKIYGDADVTVSTVMLRVAPDTVGNGFTGEFWTWYWISTSVPVERTSEITYCPSYPAAPTPLIRIGVSTSIPGKDSDNFTLMILDEVTPSPARMLLIPTSAPLDPTIRYSSTFAWISKEDEG